MAEINVTSPIYQSGIVTPAAQGADAKKPETPKSDEKPEIKEEIASKACAQGSKALALAQILTGTNLRNDITVEEYVDQLKKQGKIEGKDYEVHKPETLKDNDGNELFKFCKMTDINEYNKNHEQVKRVGIGIINNKPYVSCDYLNHKTNNNYKTVAYEDNGDISVYNNDPVSGERVICSKYDKNAKLKSYEVSKNADNVTVTKSIDMLEDGSVIPPL